jgi:tight adherence protein B
MLTFSTALFFLITFVVAGLALALVWFALQKIRSGNGNVTGTPLGLQQQETSKILRNESISTISFWAKLLERFDFIELMKRQIQQAGLNWSVGRVTSMMLLTGTVALVALVKGGWFPSWMNAALAYGASLTPYFYILRKRAKRFVKFEAQFPDALDSLSRALRAGHPFAAALEIVASEAEAPVSTELRAAAIEGNFGTSWQRALENLSQRVPLLEVNMFAAAVQLHNRTGGKLSEVLGTLSEGMREAGALKGEVRSIAAHGKLTGLILTVLPIVIAFIMMLVNPSYLGILLNHPAGKYLIGAAIVCLIIAHFVIRRIVDIKV